MGVNPLQLDGVLAHRPRDAAHRLATRTLDVRRDQNTMLNTSAQAYDRQVKCVQAVLCDVAEIVDNGTPGSISRVTNPPDVADFKIELDPLADQWLETHQTYSRIVITFSVTRCCGGPPVRDVRLRVDRLEEARRGGFVRIGCVADRDVYLDHRLMKTMPRRIPITLHRSLGRQHLILDFSGEQWGRLLYS